MPETKFKCPICGKNINEYEWGWGCSGYRDGCKFSLGKTICKKKITQKILEKLINDGETEKIEGFISKKDKEFSAKLLLNKETGAVEFTFDN